MGRGVEGSIAPGCGRCRSLDMATGATWPAAGSGVTGAWSSPQQLPALKKSQCLLRLQQGIVAQPGAVQ